MGGSVADHPLARARAHASRLATLLFHEHWRLTLVALTACVLVYAALQFLWYGFALLQWDVMPITAGIVVLPAVALSFGVERKLHGLILLVSRRAVAADTGAMRELITHRLGQSGVVYSRVGAAVAGGIEILEVIYYNGWESRVGFFAWSSLSLLLVGGVASVAVGLRLGRLSAYGDLIRIVRDNRLAYEAVPGHPDNVAGMKAFVDFYLHVGWFMAIPVLWLSIWWIAIPFWDHPRGYVATVFSIYHYRNDIILQHLPVASSPTISYLVWRRPFFIFWVLSLCFGFIAVVRPLWRLHGWMVEQKRTLEGSELPLLREQIAVLRRRMAARTGPEERFRLKMEMRVLQSYRYELETMPTYPLKLGSLVAVVLRNAAVVGGPVLIYLATTKYGHGAYQFISQLLGSL